MAPSSPSPPPLAASSAIAGLPRDKSWPSAIAGLPHDKPSPSPSEPPSGSMVLRDPSRNKSTAFSHRERAALGIRGLLPPAVESLHTQLKRVRQQFDAIDSRVQQFHFLHGIHDRNETLFYRFLVENLRETMPVVYTPTVGEVCESFGTFYRSQEGLYITKNDKGRMHEILANWPNQVDIAVVTDGSRILGLGDLGANGMGIPVGKLSLYVAGGGFHPSKALPVTLDLGTNNETLLSSDLYLGMRHKRLEGAEYYELVDEFVSAFYQRWPSALLQFEDFSSEKAFALLDKYRDQHLCFNDDIQGTGCVITAGFINALRATNSDPRSQRLVFYGAGSAGVGVADMIVSHLCKEGLSLEEARGIFYFVDSKGLVTTHRGDNLAEHKVRFARSDVTESPQTLVDIINFVKPTALFGLAAQSGAFSKQVIEALHAHTDRPIIFPLSNPTSKAECTAKEAYEWTNGQCIFASGSPFDPVMVNGKTFVPGQGNNMYCFPGIGLGAFVSQSKRVTDDMILAASEALADTISAEELDAGTVYPDLRRIREISVKIAVRVAECVFDANESRLPARPDNVESLVRDYIYLPEY